jgi:uncharacterized membrane protein YhaH (DUF805 family)
VSSPYSPYPQGDGGDQYGGYGQQPYQPYPQGGGGWEPGTQRGYLEGGPVNFGQAISYAFKNALAYKGRASRSAYWWFFLFSFIIDVIVVGIRESSTTVGVVFGAIVGICMLAAWIPLFVRRLHDSNKSGYWALLYLGVIAEFIGRAGSLVTLVALIVIIVFACLPGTPGPNRFG